MTQNLQNPAAAPGNREPCPSTPAAPSNAVEGYKASMNGDGLGILDHLPEIIERGADSLTPREKELLKWVGVFYRRPTPGKFHDAYPHAQRICAERSTAHDRRTLAPAWKWRP